MRISQPSNDLFSQYYQTQIFFTTHSYNWYLVFVFLHLILVRLAYDQVFVSLLYFLGELYFHIISSLTVLLQSYSFTFKQKMMFNKRKHILWSNNILCTMMHWKLFCKSTPCDSLTVAKRANHGLIKISTEIYTGEQNFCGKLGQMNFKPLCAMGWA